MEPYFVQECRYCKESALFSLKYGDKAGEYFPVCNGHAEEARYEIKRMGRGVLDRIMVDFRAVPSTTEARMAQALKPVPRYPAPTAESFYGRRVNARRAVSAVAEADGLPSNIPTKELPAGFLQALGGEWRNLRAFRVHSERLTVHIDDQKFTVYTRKG